MKSQRTRIIINVVDTRNALIDFMNILLSVRRGLKVGRGWVVKAGHVSIRFCARFLCA